jgi:hypothetical protein
MLKRDIKIGMHVKATPLQYDVFDEFVGTVKKFDGPLVIVEDQDGDCWSCERGQISKINENE